MGCAAGRPRIFACAKKPDGVGGEASGLGLAGDLDGRIARLWSKKGFIQGAGQDGEKSLPGEAAAVEAKRSGGLDNLLPAVGSLEFGARKRGGGGKVDGFEELRN